MEDQLVTVNVTEYPEDGSTVEVRMVGLGLGPAIVLTPDVDTGELDLRLSHVTGAEAAAMLRAIADQLAQEEG